MDKSLVRNDSDEYSEPVVEMREIIVLNQDDISLEDLIVNENNLDDEQTIALYAQYHSQENFPEKIKTLMPKLQKITDNKNLKIVNRQYDHVSKHFYILFRRKFNYNTCYLVC